jgi:predicted  nucleic acid-binding Zn-ribbon protein
MAEQNGGKGEVARGQVNGNGDRTALFMRKVETVLKEHEADVGRVIGSIIKTALEPLVEGLMQTETEKKIVDIKDDLDYFRGKNTIEIGKIEERLDKIETCLAAVGNSITSLPGDLNKLIDDRINGLKGEIEKDKNENAGAVKELKTRIENVNTRLEAVENVHLVDKDGNSVSVPLAEFLNGLSGLEDKLKREFNAGIGKLSREIEDAKKHIEALRGIVDILREERATKEEFEEVKNENIKLRERIDELEKTVSTIETAIKLVMQRTGQKDLVNAIGAIATDVFERILDEVLGTTKSEQPNTGGEQQPGEKPSGGSV